MYAVIEIDTKGNYRGTIEKANVLVTAFGTDLNYIENQAAKGTELKIKKEPDSRGIDPSNRRYDIDESNSETGDVPSPDANIPPNGNSVNTIVYEKAVDGSFYAVEAVPDSKYKTLWVETAYMKKEKPSHEPDERFRSPGKTSETNILPTSQTGDVPSPDANIPPSGNSVNTIVYEKAVDGSFYVVEAVPDSKAKKLRLITAYISKKTSSAQVAHANKSRESTPETSLHTDGVQGDVPSPKTNIPQNGNTVNNKKQSNFEKAVQKKAPGVFAPGAFVQLLKVKELFLAFHFCIALAAINRTILSGFERNFCFAAAGSAGGGVHFFLGFDFVFACIAALFATLGLVNEAALCIEFLFAGGESELFSAFFAH